MDPFVDSKDQVSFVIKIAWLFSSTIHLPVSFTISLAFKRLGVVPFELMTFASCRCDGFRRLNAGFLGFECVFNVRRG